MSTVSKFGPMSSTIFKNAFNANSRVFNLIRRSNNDNTEEYIQEPINQFPNRRI